MGLFKRKHNDQQATSALIVDTETVLRVLTHYPPNTKLSFGAPVRCPSCSDFGLVEKADRATGRWDNRCVSCGTEWTMSIGALSAAREALAAGAELLPPTPVTEYEPTPAMASGGVLFQRRASGDVGRTELPPVTTPTAARWAVPIQVAAEPRVPMRLLIVEDDPSDLAVVKAILEPAGPDAVDLRWAPTRAAGEAAARSDEPDLVLLDLGLPDSHGFQTVTQWHFSNVEAPVLVVSGAYGAEVVDRGRELGVTGFIDKAELGDLLAEGDEGTTKFLDRLELAAAH